MDPQKYAAIKEYLGTRRYAVTEYVDGTHGTTQFQILREEGRSPLIALTDEFIADFDVHEILEKLTEWTVREKALDAPDKLLVVTTRGIEMKPRG